MFLKEKRGIYIEKKKILTLVGKTFRRTGREALGIGYQFYSRKVTVSATFGKKS